MGAALSATAFREITREDLPAVLASVRALQADLGDPFDEATVLRALEEAVTDPRHGRLYLILEDGTPVGHLALSFGFTVVHGGRDALVDEVYVMPSRRGRGHGRAAMAFAEQVCGEMGMAAVSLAVHRENHAARRLYASLGYQARDWYLMVKRLGGPSATPR